MIDVDASIGVMVIEAASAAATTTAAALVARLQEGDMLLLS
jgi:hypothetical protein